MSLLLRRIFRRFFVPLAWDDVPVRRKPDRRALEEAVLVGAEGVPAMQQEAVVPHDQVARPPVVAVDELGPGGVFDQFVEQRLGLPSRPCLRSRPWSTGPGKASWRRMSDGCAPAGGLRQASEPGFLRWARSRLCNPCTVRRI